MTDHNVLERAEREQVQQLLAELRHGPVPLTGAAESDDQRQRLLPVVRERVRSIPSVRQRRRRVQKLCAALVVSVVAGATVLTTKAPRSSGEPERVQLRVDPGGGALSLVQSGTSTTVDSITTIAASGILESTELASVTTPGGVRIALGQHTRVGLDGLTEGNPDTALRLLAGRVECTVPPLGTTRRFSVITPDAKIAVHGTRFSVSTGHAAVTDETMRHGHTCVRVSEGRVEVLSAGGRRFLTAGQQWGCEDERAALSSRSSHEVPPASAPKLSVKKITDPAPRPPATVPSTAPSSQTRRAGTAGTLEQETQLLSRALAAERRGERRAAGTLYAELLRRYPRSPLAPEAQKGQARVK